MADLRTVRLISFGASPVVTAGTLHGSFERQGLVIEHTETPNSTVQMRGLCTGEFDIASTAFDNVLAWSGREGAEIVAIAPAGQGIVLPVVVRPEINDWEDLRGKPLAVDAVDTAFALVLRRVLQAHGLDLDAGDYEFVPAGATGYRFESMEKGETFAAVLNPPWNQRAVEAGMKAFGDHREVLPNYPGGVYAVSRKFAEENREVVVGFLKGLVEASNWVSDPATADLAAKRLAAESGSPEDEVRSRLGRITPDMTINRDGLEVVLDLRVRFGLTPAMGPDLSVYVDTSYGDAAT
jgi:ABC-type nitrate/sulfonate/bicarbonate transport system substrate-binding protein